MEQRLQRLDCPPQGAGSIVGIGSGCLCLVKNAGGENELIDRLPDFTALLLGNPGERFSHRTQIRIILPGREWTQLIATDPVVADLDCLRDEVAGVGGDFAV
jgi:hypothetical protein